ncbi:DUF4832 domain-containing protein [Paenibacillus sp. HB172176]|uniref:DUF4832 domain-containing protein n=1 Tax=Paenibacillus sp. HB172176 TaxID=2493690 RepID=UPI00143B4352|nr:DUF4832 domain-containing protein [Paenibacillus sp. HB172176]
MKKMFRWPGMLSLLAIVLAVGAVSWPVQKANADVGTLTVNLSETSEAFKNPNSGFRPSVYIGSTNFPDKEYTSIYKQYIPYTDLENLASDSVQKIKDWSNTAWAGLESRNLKVVPRVVIVYPNVGEYWPDGIPHGDPAGQWLSDTYKNRMIAFIDKLGQAWNDDPRVAAVEFGLFGNWGEQHIYPNKFADGTDRIPLSFQQALGDAYVDAFPDKKVMVRYPETFVGYPFGIQWDSFALPDDASGGNGEVARDTWRTQINSGEVAYDWGDQSNLGGSPDGTLGSVSNTNYVIDWIMKTHTSSLGWIAEYNASNSAVETGATAMQKVLGYRYVINQASFSGNVQPGGTMDVSFNVTNKGSSPFYYDWPVEASLLNADKTVAWKGVFNADIRDWLPGTDWNTSSRAYNNAPATNAVSGSFTIPGNLANGTYTLALSILDPAGWKPSVRFANTNYYTGGYTPIGKVGIGGDPANQNLGSFNSLKSDNTLSYSLISGPYDGGITDGGDSGDGGDGGNGDTGGSSASYEAEASGNTLLGGAVISSCSNCSGGSKVGYVGDNSGTLQFNGISAGAAGSATVTISYLNGGSARSAQMSVNGGAAVTVNFPGTGSWTTIGTVQSQINLNAGNNTIKFSNPSGWAPDFDRIEVSAGSGGGGSTQPPGGGSTPTPPPTGSGLLLDDFDGSPSWPGSNDLDNWAGANSFTNGAGVIESGALKLQYNNNGWLGTDVNQDLSGYSKMVIRVKGAAGGEQSDFNLSIGGVEKSLESFSGDTITTSYKDIEIDLVANGVNRSAPGQLTMTFWHGGSGTIWIDEIRFE